MSAEEPQSNLAREPSTAPKSQTDTAKKRPRKAAEPKSRRKAADKPESAEDDPAPNNLGPTHVVYHHQPYPPPFIMNPPPNYPLNGSPFTHPPPPPGYPPQSSPQPNGQPMPAHPYSYAMPTGYPPPPPGYPYQYHPQSVVMYGSPPNQSQEPPQSPNQQPQASTSGANKRKRKSGGKGKESDDEQTAAEIKKRTKTQRACDSCRSRKIRCDIMQDSEPPTCHHCKNYGFECTFFLPITETRFKRKKADEEGAEKSGPVQGESSSGVFTTAPSRVYETHEVPRPTFEVSRAPDGSIQLQPGAESLQQPLVRPLDVNLTPQIIQDLVNDYFAEVSPLLPVITHTEFLAHRSPPPILLYSICLVAAARREAPQAVFDSIRTSVNSIIKTDDVLSTASIVNVQAILILCMTGDCHSPFVPTALSALWMRLGTAIRMAQDLGLHRAESVSQDIEMRRRLWGACVISDRWTSLIFGHPFMINVEDCDARLPSSGEPYDLYVDEFVRLSILLGRVLKTIYSPSGLSLVTDEILASLLSDIEAWQRRLPDSLKFRGPGTSLHAGLLHGFYFNVLMLFWRVFMRISYSCPAHLTFSLNVEQWNNLVVLSSECIDWLDAHERTYDVWLLVAYVATSCAFVQYHTWVRRKDSEPVAKLEKLRGCVRRWEGSISPDHMSARRKTAEIIGLLYEATQGPPIETASLNGPVDGKRVGALDYKKDANQPGSIFIAAGSTPASTNGAGPNIHGMGMPASSEGEAALRAASTLPPLFRNHNDPLRASSFVSPNSLATQPTSIVNFTPLDTGYNNLNPAMNTQMVPQNNVLNALDMPQANDNSLAELSMMDVGLLEGIPGSMFDWGQWDTFFKRFDPADGGLAQAAQA